MSAGTHEEARKQSRSDEAASDLAEMKKFARALLKQHGCSLAQADFVCGRIGPIFAEIPRGMLLDLSGAGPGAHEAMKSFEKFHHDQASALWACLILAYAETYLAATRPRIPNDGCSGRLH